VSAAQKVRFLRANPVSHMSATQAAYRSGPLYHVSIHSLLDIGLRCVSKPVTGCSVNVTVEMPDRFVASTP